MTSMAQPPPVLSPTSSSLSISGGSDLERRVAEAKQSVQRAVKLAHSYLTEAQQASKAAVARTQRIKQYRERLLNGASQLRDLRSRVEELLTDLQEKCNWVYTESKTGVEDFESAKTGLDSILGKLRRHEVDADLQRVSGHDSLYDFVDEESVTSLLRNALAEMKLLSQFMEESYKYLSAVADESRTLDEQYGSILEDAAKYKEPTEEEDSFTSDLDDMTMGVEDVEELARQVDSTCLKTTQSSVRTEDADGNIRASVTKVYDRVTLLYRSLQEVLARVGSLDSLAQRLSMQFVTIMQSVTELESFLTELREKLVVVKTMHFHCEDHVAAMAAATEEIKKLTLWYENYIRAHDELPSEIRRRIDFEKKQQELIDKFRQEMGALVSEEIIKRSDFNEVYGRYLPESLCPGLAEQAIEVTVTPSFVSSILWTAFESQLNVSEEQRQLHGSQTAKDASQQHGSVNRSAEEEA